MSHRLQSSSQPASSPAQWLVHLLAAALFLLALAMIWGINALSAAGYGQTMASVFSLVMGGLLLLFLALIAYYGCFIVSGHILAFFKRRCA